MNTFLKSLITKQDVLESSEIQEADFMVLTPTQEEINELDQVLIKELKKRGAKPKNRPIDDVKAEEKQYNKNYYAQKKENLESVKCSVCDGVYSYYSKSKHLKSRKHLFKILLENQKNNI